MNHYLSLVWIILSLANLKFWEEIIWETQSMAFYNNELNHKMIMTTEIDYLFHEL